MKQALTPAFNAPNEEDGQTTALQGSKAGIGSCADGIKDVW